MNFFHDSQDETYSVVSGQQVGLLGGPIFILYKILGVYHLANHFETLGKTLLKGSSSQIVDLNATQNVQPIFWLEGNDADFNEIKFFYGLNSHQEINRYEWNPKQPRGQPIGNYLIDNDLLKLYQEYFVNMTTTPYTAEVKDLVFSSYRLGDTLLTANQNFYKALFEKFEQQQNSGFKKIVWFRSDFESFRSYSQNLLQKEIMTTQEGEQCSVFALVDGRREPLYKQKKNCLTRNGKVVHLQDATLLPSVWNRSILQDAYLKAIGYVAGPGEIKYLQDLIPRYQAHQVNPAQVIPRMSVTVVDNGIIESVQNLELTVEDVVQYDLHYLYRRLQERDVNLKTNFKNMRKKLREEKEKLIKELKHIPGKNLLEVKKKEKEKYVEMKHIIGKKRREFKINNLASLTQLKKLGNWLHPQVGSRVFPQERFHNLVTLLNRYGVDMISDIYQEYQFTQKIINQKKPV